MRRVKVIVLLLLVALVTAILIGFARRPARSMILADGSTLRLEKIKYGKREAFQPENSLYERMRAFTRAHLPKSMTKRIPPPPTAAGSMGMMNSIAHTNDDSLLIYFSRWNPATNDYVGFEYATAVLIDEHGCEFRATASGTYYDPFRTARPMPAGAGMFVTMPVPTLNWLSFESFPRDARQFKVRIYGDRKFQGEFTVENPLRSAAATSDKRASTLPVSTINGGTTFTLKSLTYRTNFDSWDKGDPFFTNRLGIVPEFEVMENGARTTNWVPFGAELWDSSGNFATQLFPYHESISNALFLCPENVTWKYAVQFCVLENTASVSNAAWKIADLHVPGRGEYLPLPHESISLAGVNVKMCALGGVGETIYGTDRPIRAAAPIDAGDLESWFIVQPYPRDGQPIRTGTPHVAFLVDGLKENQRLTIRVRDDQGRQYYAAGPEDTVSVLPKDVYFAKTPYQKTDIQHLNLFKDSKVVELTVTVHTARTVEFKFKPPPR